MATLQQIVAYIKQYKAKFSIPALRQQLLKQKVPPATIETAIQMATGQAPGAGAPPAARPAQPPAARPPAGQIPATRPPGAQPPSAQPPAARPPATQPPAEVPPPNPLQGAPTQIRRGIAPPVKPPPGRSYILVVDDDPLIRDMLVAKLEDAGYRVTCAEDAAQQVIQAEGMRLSLILSDIEMPGFGTGVDALKKLRASSFVRKNLPVVFITGMPPADARKIVPKTDPYVRLVHKPVDWALLQQYIEELTGMNNPLV